MMGTAHLYPESNPAGAPQETTESDGSKIVIGRVADDPLAGNDDPIHTSKVTSFIEQEVIINPTGAVGTEETHVPGSNDNNLDVLLFD